MQLMPFSPHPTVGSLGPQKLGGEVLLICALASIPEALLDKSAPGSHTGKSTRHR